MALTTLIDYGCHSFTYELAVLLRDQGVPIRYFVNGSLESPNQSSLERWSEENPDLLRNIRCKQNYGKMNLAQRLLGEISWAQCCIDALEEERPSAIVASCIPLVAIGRIQNWARRNSIPFIYWLQDLQGKATHDLLGKRYGRAGRIAGSLAHIWELELLDRSQMVITIADSHKRALPKTVVDSDRYALLENWININEFGVGDVSNEWSRQHSLSETRNIIYSGTLGMKHDISVFARMARAYKSLTDVRIVVVSSGEAANTVAQEAKREQLSNLIVLPFQPHREVPNVLASASVLFASLERSAGSFCIPSKVLAYLCAGRPIVIALDEKNPAATMVVSAGAGAVVRPGQVDSLILSISKYLNDRDLLLSTGQSAREYAERTFNLEGRAVKFLEILEHAGVAFTARRMNHAVSAA